MNSLLVIWTIVAAAGTSNMNGNGRDVWGWRPIGVFINDTRCFEAARRMGYDEKKFLCLPGAAS